MQRLEELGLFFPGSRIGIMLIHGLGGTPVEMKIVAKRLNRYGFSVLCPLLAGHCSSEADLVATTWNDWTASVQNAHERMVEHMDVIFAGGLSAGAVLSLYTAQRNPGGIRGLVLYSITLRWDGWSIPKFVTFLMPLLLRLPYISKRYRFEEVYPYGLMNEKLRNRIHAQMQSGDAPAAGLSSTPGTSMRELWRLVDIVKKNLPGLSTPTLLIHARNDDIAHLRNSVYVQRRLGGPAELLLLENSYHIITVDQERNTVCDATAVYFHSLLDEAEKKELARHAQAVVPECMPESRVSNGAIRTARECCRPRRPRTSTRS
jgi:carboxylesterase